VSVITVKITESFAEETFAYSGLAFTGINKLKTTRKPVEKNTFSAVFAHPGLLPIFIAV
jgi:hypothetical protein